MTEAETDSAEIKAEQAKEGVNTAPSEASNATRMQQNMQEEEGPVGAYSKSSLQPQFVSSTPDTKSNYVDLWKEESKTWREKPWMESTQGRLTIRLFSRGLLGALFYTVGGRIADQALNRYDKDAKVGSRARYEQQYNKWYHRAIRGLAKGVDTFAGKPIETIFGTKAVTFRETRKFGRRSGRSLGHELVDVTFNFASASFGDGLGRNIAAVMDPNIETQWLHGRKFDIVKLGKNLMSSTLRLLTYNAGEDWAVALPYVYFMKTQRSIINKISPGWKVDFDFQMNGGSYKTAENGNIVQNKKGYDSFSKGSYFWESAIDFQTRFTFYNIGTLMFRETYKDAISRFNRWKDSGFTISPLYSNGERRYKGIVQRSQQLIRYMINSAVRGTLMMTPTVPFFWIFHIPQSKFRGLAIDRKTGRPLEYASKYLIDLNRGSPFVKVNGDTKIKDSYKNTSVPVHRRENDGTPEGKLVQVDINPFGVARGKHGEWQRFNPYPKGGKIALVNALGQWSNKLALVIANFIEEPRKGFSNRRSRLMREFTRTHIHSAMSYTPYFMAKTEFAELWGTEALKLSIDRMLDGIEAFSKKEFKAGAKDFWRAFWRRGDLGEVGYGSVFTETKSTGQGSAQSTLHDSSRAGLATKLFSKGLTDNHTMNGETKKKLSAIDDRKHAWRERVGNTTAADKETELSSNLVPA